MRKTLSTDETDFGLTGSKAADTITARYRTKTGEFRRADYYPGGSLTYYAQYRRGADSLEINLWNTPFLFYAARATWSTDAASAVRDGVSGQQYTRHHWILGSPTVPAEIPATPSYDRCHIELYALSLAFAHTVDSTGSSTPALSVAADGTFTTVFSTTSFPSGPFTVTGRLDRATNRITGTFTNAAGTISGTLIGRLYGPSARELALVLKANNATGTNEVAGEMACSPL